MIRVRPGVACALVAVISAAPSARGDQREELQALTEAVLLSAADPLRAARTEVFPSEDSAAVEVSGALPEALTQALRTQLSQALSARGDAIAESVEGAQRALRVAITVGPDGLVAQPAVQTLLPSAWDRFIDAPPPSPPRALPAITVPLGPALRAALGMPARPSWPPSGVVRPRTIPTPFRDVVAVAVGRLGALPAVAMATTDSLRVARFEARSLAFLPQTWSLHPLGAVASPPREPIGALRWDGQGLRVRTSAQRLTGALSLEGDGLSRTLRAEGDAWPTEAGDLRVDARPARVHSGPDPSMRAAFPAVRGAVRVDCDGAGACVVREGDLVRGALRNVTPPVLLDDLDGDGAPEVLLATASAPDAPDRVRVFTLRDGALLERASVPTPGPVLALAAGALPEGRGLVIAARDLARGAVTLLLAP